MYLIPEIQNFHEDMIKWRHDFHRRPEVGFHEVITSARIADLLRSFGIDEVLEGIGKTGVIGIARNQEGGAIGLRADMDALPISDEGTHEYKSMTNNVTHACGHDGHMAMLLGAAKYLANSRTFRGTVALIFQPAEETTSGAKGMIEHGFLDEYGITSIYGLHTLPALAEGKMSITPGTALAGVDNFKITLTGKGGHAGSPQDTRDPVVASGFLISALQTIVSRRMDPISSVVISITSIQSSSNVQNVIPQSVKLMGTIRYLEVNQGDAALCEMKKLMDGIAQSYGLTAKIEHERKSPPVVNSSEICMTASAIAESLLGPGNVISGPPIMGGEDFAYYLDKIPGVFAFIGNGEDSLPLHNSAFDFNDKILPIGASYLARIVETVLVPSD